MSFEPRRVYFRRTLSRYEYLNLPVSDVAYIHILWKITNKKIFYVTFVRVTAC